MQNTLYSCQMSMKFNFLDRCSNKVQIINFMKTLLMGAELFYTNVRTDGRTNTTKLIAVFRSFSKAPKNNKQWPKH